MNTKIRRSTAIALVIFGGVLFFFAAESVFGWILMGLGILVEAMGIFLEKKR